MTRREVHSEDIPSRVLPDLDMSEIDTDPADRTPEIIVADPERASRDYLGELAFMEEPVSIYLYRGQEEFSPDSIPLWVQGRMVSVPVEQEVTLRRKFVEVLARSQPYKLTTKVFDNSDGGNIAVQNKWMRHQASQYPFTLTRDSDRGRAWLERVKREG